MVLKEFEDKLCDLISEYINNHEDKLSLEKRRRVKIDFADEKYEVTATLTFEVLMEKPL